MDLAGEGIYNIYNEMKSRMMEGIKYASSPRGTKGEREAHKRHGEYMVINSI